MKYDCYWIDNVSLQHQMQDSWQIVRGRINFKRKINLFPFWTGSRRGCSGRVASQVRPSLGGSPEAAEDKPLPGGQTSSDRGQVRVWQEPDDARPGNADAEAGSGQADDTAVARPERGSNLGPPVGTQPLAEQAKQLPGSEGWQSAAGYAGKEGRRPALGVCQL